ncbi:MAG: RHS repeat-associated core domain-containing protein, partial [Bacteroidota bacterium]
SPISGDRTNLSATYTYDPITKKVKQITGLNQRSGTSTAYNYNFFYDVQSRLNKVTEQTDHANFEKRLTYNSFERVATEQFITTDLSSGVNTNIRVKNVYDGSGILEEVRNDFNNALLWKVNSQNARGQDLNLTLGNGITQTRQYDNFGFVSNMTDQQNSTGGTTALELDFDFDEDRGNLNSRTNHAFTGWNESFAFDNLDRLTTISGPANRSHSYDSYGRISLNSTIGSYSYASNSRYQLQSVNLNNQGDIFYQGQGQQQVTFNSFQKPVEMSATGNGKVSIEYSPLMSRAQAYYGGDQDVKQQRRFHKQYSGLTPVEIVKDKTTGGTKIITYVAGDAYTAPIAHIRRVDSNLGNLNEYHYLHRDYLGSIMAITNSSGAIREERQFGAWGTVDNYRDHLGRTEFSHLSLIGRGYTGHEHFFEVGLIHMNGRLYDANLGRFLSPDNYIQEPMNTQSYNRYAYVFNNPLSFSDPSGDIAFLVILKAVLIGAAIGAGVAAATYAVGALITGSWDWGSFGKAVLFGALAGAISGGLSAAGGSAGAAAAAKGSKIGAFLKKASVKVLAEITSKVGQALISGDKITWGLVIGATVGGLIGTIPGLDKVVGAKVSGRLAKAAISVLNKSIQEAVKGSIGGVVKAAIDGKDIWKGFVQGAYKGALSGAVKGIVKVAYKEGIFDVIEKFA